MLTLCVVCSELSTCADAGRVHKCRPPVLVGELCRRSYSCWHHQHAPRPVQGKLFTFSESVPPPSPQHAKSVPLRRRRRHEHRAECTLFPSLAPGSVGMYNFDFARSCCHTRVAYPFVFLQVDTAFISYDGMMSSLAILPAKYSGYSLVRPWLPSGRQFCPGSLLERV